MSTPLSGDGSHALSGSHDNTRRWWDLQVMRCLAVFPCNSPVTAVAFSPKSPSLVAAGCADGQVLFFELCRS